MKQTKWFSLVGRSCRSSSLLGTSVLTAATAGLEPQQLKNPPAEAKPLTWMHMMDGNASKAGLSKDLKALSDAGLGGGV